MKNLRLGSFLLFTLSLLTLVTIQVNYVSAQATDVTDTCSDVRYLMQDGRTPYDFGSGGGIISSSGDVTSTIPDGNYVDFWAFTPTQKTSLNLSFSNLQGAALEYTLFRGLLSLSPYQPVNQPLNAILDEGGNYTIVVRRQHIADQQSAGYTLRVDAGNALKAPTQPEIRNAASNNLAYTPSPTVQNGVLAIDLPTADIRLHLDGTNLVHPRDGISSQVYFPADTFTNWNTHTVHLANWAQHIAFLGGDLSATGNTNGQNHIYFLQDFDYRLSLSGGNDSELYLTNVAYPDGTTVQLNWDIMQGIWVMNDCTGIKLHDGRSFVAMTPSQDRFASFTGSLEEFTIKINALAVDGSSQRYEATLNWTGIRTDTEITLRNGIFDFQLDYDRSLALESTSMSFSSIAGTDSQPEVLNIELYDRDTTVTLDWTNMSQFKLADDQLTFTFTDAPRGETVRDAQNLWRFEALNDVIHIVDKDTPEGNPGQQRLLLPASESYLEIVTPAGSPSFVGTALPGEPGYIPRALNNLGGDCYPANTILTSANCPPAGEANPANGNLWLTATDHMAQGAVFNLDLTRNYNSRAATEDGPFGYGWTTSYLFDYNVPFDPVSSSRLIDGEIDYPVSLDLTWAPRGIVIFRTASGSLHQFVSAENRPTPGTELRAVTMPGWTLARGNLRSPYWELHQDNGLVYRFDRAGRLLEYGDLQRGRMIQIEYPYTTLNGPGSLGADYGVVIRDTAANDQRELVLFYDEQHHVTRSILRDLTQSTHGEACSLEQNCYETLYQYSDGLLIKVIHNTGQEASYQYDNYRRLIAHDDPYAPQHRRMRYTYTDDGNITNQELLLADGTPKSWRSFSPPQIIDDKRIVTVMDEWGSSRTLTYHLADSQNLNLRAAGEHYTLVEETSPLAAVDEFEAVPQTYTWNNGLLTQVDSRIFLDGQGRNGTDYQYTSTGRITCIACSLDGRPELAVTYDPDPVLNASVHLPQTISYADGTTELFEYNEGRISSYTDRNTGVYQYDWDETTGNLAQVRRGQDGATWVYTYNSVGLVQTLSYYVSGSPSEQTPYEVLYTWDGLGRLIAVDDRVLGHYTIDYTPPYFDESRGDYVSQITLTDPAGIITRTLFDATGNLIESEIHGAESALQLTRYTYDDYGRLREERQIRPEEDGGDIVTTYTYEARPVLESSVIEGTETVINGYTLRITNPLGLVSEYTYDAQGRLRRHVNEDRRVSVFWYSVRDTGQNFGLQVTQRSLESGADTYNEYVYIFDARHQLRRVSSVEKTLTGEPVHEREDIWDIFPNGDTARQGSLKPSVSGRAISLTEVVWKDYVNGYPAGVATRQAVLKLISDAGTANKVQNDHRPALNVTYDFAGRPQQIIDGTEQVFPIVYCAEAQGATRTVYGMPDDTNLSCQSESYRLALTHDYHGRLIQAKDVSGQRVFTYTAGDRQWLVNATFTASDGSNHTWALTYDGAGNLVEWIDEDGFQRIYDYDTLGWLRAVTVPDHPEQSYVFTYNPSGLLVDQLDGLGRGVQYNYNQAERVTSRLDKRTAAAYSFTYNAAGMLSTIISPMGNTTTFLYEDPADPARLTSVIEPTGSQHRFEWEDERNRMIYTNPFNQYTAYNFDGMGLLWRIDDPISVDVNERVFVDQEFASDVGNRSHEIHYDSAANLTDWLYDVRTDNPSQPARWLTITSESSYDLTIGEKNTDWTRQLNFYPDGRLRAWDEVNYTYDPLGRLREILTPSHRWSLQYGQQQVTLQGGFGIQTVLHYDNLYRLVAETVADTTNTYTYTSNEETGQITMTVTHPDEQPHIYVFSPENDRTAELPTITLLTDGQRIQYQYNAEGWLERIVVEICNKEEINDITACVLDTGGPNQLDTSKMVWQFAYDTTGRPVRIMYPDDSLEIFTYNDGGNLITYQDTSNHTFHYFYDQANRLVRVTSPTGIKIILNYGRLDTVTGICRTRTEESDLYKDCQAAGGELETYTYDSLLRLESRTYPGVGGTQHTVGYRYDSSGEGRLTAFGTNGNEVGLTYNDLGLLDTLTIGGNNYNFSYYDLNQLTQAGDLTFNYDGSNRVQTYGVGGQYFTYTYSPDGYTLGSQNSGALDYRVDPRGLLQSLSFTQQPQPRLELDYTGIEAVDLTQFNTNAPYYTISQSLTPNLLPQSLFWLYMPDLTISRQYFHTVYPGSITQRQEFTQPKETGGYVTVQGYDNDSRPLTMRITDLKGLNVRFTQSFIYNDQGQRKSETQQYDDGTQVITRYSYDGDYLIERRVTIIRPLAVSVPAFSLLLFGLIWSGTTRKRTFILLIAGTLATGLVFSLRLAYAQTDENYIFTYHYNDQGNLSQVSYNNTTCRAYNYDSGERLISVSGSNGTINRNYRYDAYNRLQGANGIDLVYQGDSSQILSTTVAGQTYYFGQIAGQPPYFMTTDDGQLTWLLHDGRQRLLGTYEKTDAGLEASSEWFFDPRGRYLSLESPPVGFDPCTLDNPNLEITPPLELQTLTDGLVWDALTGLYFADGHTYDPVIGRSLQRTPNGPDILGTVYNALYQQNLPIPQDADTPVYLQGMDVLRDALEMMQINEGLTAEAVLRQQLPTLQEIYTPIYGDLQTARQAFDTTLVNLLNLPLWLENHYNLSAPYSDPLTGALQVPQIDIGQSGLGGEFTSPFTLEPPQWTDDLLTSITSPTEYLKTLSEQSIVPVDRLHRGYVPSFQQSQSVGVIDLWQDPTKPFTNIGLPEDVFDYIPQTLPAPHSSAYVLDAIQLMAQLPRQNAADWVEQTLDIALPQTPSLPPANAESWREQWFSNDTFGLANQLDYDLPALPSQPFYPIGINEDRLFTDR